MSLATESQAVNPDHGSGAIAGPAAPNPRFVFVDALRGIAAMWVVLYHAYEGKHLDGIEPMLPGTVLAVLGSGNLGVSIFFVLSGFVIAYSVSRHRVDARFVGRFALRRSIRLDPPYWASIALTLGFGYLANQLVPGKSFRFPDVATLAAHLMYLQSILELPAINVVYWTLCLEIQFYLVFCLLMALAQRFRRDDSDRRSLRAIFVPAAFVAAAWPLRIITETPWPGLFLPFWYGFLLGASACWAMQKIIPLGWFYAYALMLGLGAIWHSDRSAMTCVLTAILLAEAARRGKLAVWLDFRGLLFLGMISYSLYLIHNPITGAFYRVAYKITGRSAAAEVFWFVPMIGVNVASAFGFWWLFERTSLAMGHRIRLSKTSTRSERAATSAGKRPSVDHPAGIHPDPA